MKAKPHRRRLSVLLAWCFCSASSLAQGAPVDDARVRQLEMDVRALQLVIEQQARRIDTLENAIRQSRAGRSAAPNIPVPPANKSPAANDAWLQSANWDKLRPGMSEADVIRVLGQPTTVRNAEDGQSQTLFYAREIDAGGFLSGSVVIADQRILQIHKPALK